MKRTRFDNDEQMERMCERAKYFDVHVNVQSDTNHSMNN